MIIFTYEKMIAVDCDSTLVYTVTPIMSGIGGLTKVKLDEYGNETERYELAPKGVDMSSYDLAIEDPYGVMGTIYLKKHKPNINLVRRCYAQGHRMYIWSAAGALWASTVATALHLEQFFEFSMVKPSQYIDDKDIATWCPDRLYLPHDHPGCWLVDHD